MPEIADPTVGKAYRLDPNYYRLGYQLAAQTAHRAEANHESTHKRALDILYGDRRRAGGTGPGNVREAEAFLAEAEEVLGWFRERKSRKRWGFLRGRLEPKEELLETFLCRTLIPCLTIVIAASIRQHNPKEAERRIAPLRERAGVNGRENPELTPISYRALYNMACYEAVSEPREEKYLRFLAAALDRAPGARRLELGRWALKDPSLKAFQQKPAFQELLKPYEEERQR